MLTLIKGDTNYKPAKATVAGVDNGDRTATISAIAAGARDVLISWGLTSAASTTEVMTKGVFTTPVYTENKKIYFKAKGIGANGIIADEWSTVGSVDIVMPQAAKPYADIEAGVVALGTEVSLFSDTGEDVDIFYTTNGDTPDDSKTKFTDPIEIEQNTTIKAIAIGKLNKGFLDSDVVELVYKVQVAPVTADPNPDDAWTYESDITLDCETDGVSIYYLKDDKEIDGDPSDQSTEYTGVFQLSATPMNDGDSVFIKAIAIKANFEPSEVLSLEYKYIEEV